MVEQVIARWHFLAFVLGQGSTQKMHEPLSLKCYDIGWIDHYDHLARSRSHILYEIFPGFVVVLLVHEVLMRSILRSRTDLW